MLDPTRRFPDPPPRREPIFNIPPVISLVLMMLVGVHAIRQVIPDAWDDQLLLRLAFTPGTATYAFDPSPVIAALQHLAAQGEAGLRQAELGRYLLVNGGVQPWTVLTYALLHGDWAHIGLNGLWLLAFGAPVAWRLGARRFLVFAAASTMAGAAAHYVTHAFDLQPVIGASAAVSGCMGAALRFVFQPELPVSAIIGLSERARAEVFLQPTRSLRELAGDRRAVAFLVVWFLANFLFGAGAFSLGFSDATIAWQAHIGGFLVGLLALPLFDRKSVRTAPPDRGDADGGDPADPEAGGFPPNG